MDSPLTALSPKKLWQHFDSIRRVPRPSKHEEQIIAFLIDWANSRDFKVEKDGTGNLLVTVPATKGHEGLPVTLIQNHVDMVCEQTPGRGFDFNSDPIEIEIRDGHVWAKGTTLGADNGVGMAAAMALADDESVPHGPLELLFTVDEETGLTGATKVDFPHLRSRRMLNLDSEEIGILYVGCAGGAQDDIELDLETTTTTHEKENTALSISVSGLLGGHSGLEIVAHRANAISILARLLWSLHDEVPFALARIEGGSAHNAIPNEANALLVIAAADKVRAEELIGASAQAARREFTGVETGLTIKSSPKEMPPSTLTTDARDRLLRLLLALPHGIYEMSADMPGLVETSNNLATLEFDSKIEGAVARILISSRSSVPEALAGLRARITAVTELAAARITPGGSYPAWRPDMQSPLLALCREEWTALTGKEPEVTAIHAGLECGIIGEKFPGMDMISFGPEIKGAHTTRERIEIESVDLFWRFLKRIVVR